MILRRPLYSTKDTEKWRYYTKDAPKVWNALHFSSPLPPTRLQVLWNSCGWMKVNITLRLKPLFVYPVVWRPRQTVLRWTDKQLGAMREEIWCYMSRETVPRCRENVLPKQSTIYSDLSILKTKTQVLCESSYAMWLLKYLLQHFLCWLQGKIISYNLSL